VPLYIKKFGGSSLSTIERIRSAANIIKQSHDRRDDVVVVVSAMQGETDRLVQLIRSMGPDVQSREYDAIVSTGEQVSAGLLAIALQQLGIRSRSYNASQIGIHTDTCHTKARITDINTQNIKDDLHQTIVPVITGFQGIDPQGSITTFGRGGSDISAVAIAAALKADECQIYTDVAGVYTSDPRVVNTARCIDTITYKEMLALANLGAKVLQPRSVSFAHKYNIPLRVCSSFDAGKGTLIVDHSNPELPVISAVGFNRRQTRISLIGLPKRTTDYADMFSEIATASLIDINMLVVNESESGTDISFIVAMSEYPAAINMAQQIADDCKISHIDSTQEMGMLSLVGLGMRRHASVASQFCRVLSEEGIAIHLIHSSEFKISALIDDQSIESAAKVLHTAFELD
jgi:aspartate kinase